MMKNVAFFFGIGILMLASCKPAQRITYNTNKLNTIEIRNDNRSLSVQTFEDIRSQSEQNATHFASQKWQVRINGEQTCINSEVLYKTPVAEQMTFIFAEHLSKQVPQLKVSINQKEHSDYYLEAKIRHFYGRQKFSTAAAVGAGFGLIGALATAGAKTEGTVIIELADIKLFNRQGDLIAMIGDFRKEYEGEFPADAHCYCIYANVNQKLAEFNEDLIRLILLELQNKR
ncbi:MAG: hypothetical protein LBH22_03735 [Bacteroidales bacterium]|jgi:hypothetical protein|nr:hypothetical protein [Bacteroidales bacterium]